MPVLHGGGVRERRKLAEIALVEFPHHEGKEDQDEKPGVAVGQGGGGGTGQRLFHRAARIRKQVQGHFADQGQVLGGLVESQAVHFVQGQALGHAK